jgi:hypothetical protein
LPKIYDIQQVFNYYDTNKKGILEYKNISEKFLNKAKRSKDSKGNLDDKNYKNEFNNEILNENLYGNLNEKDKDRDSNSFFSAKQRNMLSGKRYFIFLIR